VLPALPPPPPPQAVKKQKRANKTVDHRITTSSTIAAKESESRSGDASGIGTVDNPLYFARIIPDHTANAGIKPKQAPGFE
jgi:hypothetical protein